MNPWNSANRCHLNRFHLATLARFAGFVALNVSLSSSFQRTTRLGNRGSRRTFNASPRSNTFHRSGTRIHGLTTSGREAAMRDTTIHELKPIEPFDEAAYARAMKMAARYGVRYHAGFFHCNTCNRGWSVAQRANGCCAPLDGKGRAKAKRFTITLDFED